MRDTLHKRAYLLGTVILCVVVVLLTLLIIEARFFAQQAREMLRLKEEYANYVQGFRRMIAEHQESGQSSTGGSKKKIVTPDRQFLPVNREVNYLYTTGAAYARSRGIEELWSRWYTEPQPTVAPTTGRRRQTRRRRGRQAIVRRQPRMIAFDGDLEALSREYQFLYPIERSNFWVSSPFGPRRIGFHHGIDMAAPYGTPVKSVAHGVVVEARRAKGFGNTVMVSHANKLKTRYAHLSRIDVAVGDTVEQGQRIGRVGNTGNTRGRNGIHLHFEVLVYGKRVDPLYFFQKLRKV